jgi:hypothetical protein
LSLRCPSPAPVSNRGEGGSAGETYRKSTYRKAFKGLPQAQMGRQSKTKRPSEEPGGFVTSLGEVFQLRRREVIIRGRTYGL